MYTEQKEGRLISNIVLQSDLFDMPVVGFENHGGRTCINNNKPLGKVLYGSGNDGKSGYEGVVYKNVIGTFRYCHVNIASILCLAGRKACASCIQDSFCAFCVYRRNCDCNTSGTAPPFIKSCRNGIFSRIQFKTIFNLSRAGCPPTCVEEISRSFASHIFRNSSLILSWQQTGDWSSATITRLCRRIFWEILTVYLRRF